MRVSRNLRVRATPAIIGALAIAGIGTAAAAGGLGAARPLFAQTSAKVSPSERMQAPERHRSAGPKLDSRFAGIARGTVLSRTATRVQSAGLTYSKDGKVRVVVEARRAAEVRAAVARLGGRVETSSGGLVQAAMPPSALFALSRMASVDRVRPPFRMVEDSVSGEEVAASLATAWHEKNFTGKGVKVAIIDGGFAGLPERQAAGDLPTNVVNSDFCGGHFADATEHGTAVAEIVHEMAPDAQLYLLCIDTEVDLANAETFAKAQGVQVVNHSVGWFGPDRGDGSGPIGAVVADARAAGILWVNAAGNEAQTHWSGTFNDSDRDQIHEFAPNGDVGNTFVWPNNSVICGFLKWDEWPVGVSDFDLYLVLSSSGQELAWSAGDQTGSQPPYEELCAKQTTGTDLTVFWGIVGYRVSTSPRLDLFSISPPLQYETAAGSVTDPATSPAALAVGALCWQTSALEFYSSQGPTIDGRMKPEIVGHDSVSGGTYGAFASPCPMSGFAGTSAASPEVAGAAALVKQAFPAFGPDQLQTYLKESAKDIDVAGMDNATGAGMLQLPKPPDQVAPVSRALASSGKRGGIVALRSQASDDEGEIQLREQVFRNGRLIATLRRPFAQAATPKTFTTGWKSPKKAKGTYKHCAQAVDKAGNKSPTSCAPVAIR